jgi:hypothetical protein
MRIEEGMPYFPVGKRFYYNLENVFKWIESKETETAKTNPAAEENLQYGRLRQIR